MANATANISQRLSQVAAQTQSAYSTLGVMEPAAETIILVAGFLLFRRSDEKDRMRTIGLIIMVIGAALSAYTIAELLIVAVAPAVTHAVVG